MRYCVWLCMCMHACSVSTLAIYAEPQAGKTSTFTNYYPYRAIITPEPPTAVDTDSSEIVGERVINEVISWNLGVFLFNRGVCIKKEKEKKKAVCESIWFHVKCFSGWGRNANKKDGCQTNWNLVPIYMKQGQLSLQLCKTLIHQCLNIIFNIICDLFVFHKSPNMHQMLSFSAF